MIILHFLFSINCTVFHVLVFDSHSRSHRINRGTRVEENQVWVVVFQKFGSECKDTELSWLLLYPYGWVSWDRSAQEYLMLLKRGFPTKCSSHPSSPAPCPRLWADLCDPAFEEESFAFHQVTTGTLAPLHHSHASQTEQIFLQMELLGSERTMFWSLQKSQLKKQRSEQMESKYCLD